MTRAHSDPSSPRIAIAGAGIIGLSCALELAARGATITLYDPNTPGRGASWAAAGMIAPAFEAACEPGVHPQLFDLCLESARLWPGFAARLERESGEAVGYAPGPSLAVAADACAAQHLDGILDTLTKRNLPGDRLDIAAARRIEPSLSSDLLGVLRLETDGHVNNRAVVSALLNLCERHPSIRLECTPAPLRSRGNALEIAGHDLVLVTAGWQSGTLKVTEHGKQFSLVNWDTSLDEIDTYGGQMLSVERRADHPATTLRAGPIYMVPRGDQIVVGATMEPGRTTGMPNTDDIAGLLSDAARIVPSLADARITSTWSGVRPGTPDFAPFLGRTRQPNMFVAAGHYRNGILLTPITAQIIADQMLGVASDDLAKAFAPSRTLSAQA
jgi:glycine oxidase